LVVTPEIGRQQMQRDCHSIVAALHKIETGDAMKGTATNQASRIPLDFR
jgi:hypothetical protein